MSDVNNIDLHESDIEYVIIAKNSSDIIFDLADNDEERFLYESIINGVEKCISDAVKDNKVAQLPLIGCIRKNPVRKVIQSNHLNFRLARQSLTKEQYQEHVRSVIIDAKENLIKQDADKLLNMKLRRKNKKKYDQLYITLGKAYAEMFIQSILYLREVAYDVEVQNHFDDLNNL